MAGELELAQRLRELAQNANTAAVAEVSAVEEQFSANAAVKAALERQASAEQSLSMATSYRGAAIQELVDFSSEIEGLADNPPQEEVQENDAPYPL